MQGLFIWWEWESWSRWWSKPSSIQYVQFVQWYTVSWNQHWFCWLQHWFGWYIDKFIIFCLVSYIEKVVLYLCVQLLVETNLYIFVECNGCDCVRFFQKRYYMVLIIIQLWYVFMEWKLVVNNSKDFIMVFSKI